MNRLGPFLILLSGCFFAALIIWMHQPSLPGLAVTSSRQVEIPPGFDPIALAHTPSDPRLFIWSINKNTADAGIVRLDSEDSTLILSERFNGSITLTSFIQLKSHSQLHVFHMEIVEEDVAYYVHSYDIPGHSEAKSVAYSSEPMPGSLSISRASCSSGRIVYTRKLDMRMFRVRESFGHQVRWIPGPLKNDSPGRIIAVNSLYSKYLLLI